MRSKPFAQRERETSHSTLRALWFAAAGNPRSAAAAADGELPPLPQDGTQVLAQLIARRLSGEPLAHITGRQRFMGLEMLSTPQALIPRVETEQLASASIDLLHTPEAQHPARVIDVCTGSGNLAFAIAHHVADAEVFGTDISAEAIEFAGHNGAHLGLSARVQFRTGDLLAPFETADFIGHTDLIVCAPPYIRSTKVEQMATEIANHEPRLAFDGGPFGVTILMRLIEDAPRFLRHGGWLTVEVGLGQGAALSKRLQRDESWQEVRALADANGDTRVLLACRR
ncbi:MAG: peptide chain release factor N(5)-glutamine methyltransferase, partial [Rhodanobacter sp.]